MYYFSDRLFFREFKETELTLLYSLFSDREVMRYTLLDQCLEKSQLAQYFNKILHNNISTNNRKAYEYAIFLSSDNSFIGMGDIEINIKNEFGGCGEIGYLLLPQFWGKGFATEIAGKLLEIGFNDINLHRICASCNINNTKSEKIMKKIGMTMEC